MPIYPGDGANSANPGEGEHVARFSHGTDPMGQDRLHGMALPVTPPLADGGPVPHTVASNGRNVARCLRHLTAVSSTTRSSPRSGRQEWHHHLRCGMPLARAGEALVRVPPCTSCTCTAPQYHWLPIAINGTNRHEAGYVHCTIGGTTSRDKLASWWLMRGSEQWSTIYALAQEVDFDQEQASKVTTVDTAGAT